jgi:hypothetical protein
MPDEESDQHRRLRPDEAGNTVADAKVGRNSRPREARRNLRLSRHEASIRLMEDQFIHASVRAETELHAVTLNLAEDEDLALIGTQFVGWFTPITSVSSPSCPARQLASCRQRGMCRCSASSKTLTDGPRRPATEPGRDLADYAARCFHARQYPRAEISRQQVQSSPTQAQRPFRPAGTDCGRGDVNGGRVGRRGSFRLACMGRGAAPGMPPGRAIPRRARRSTRYHRAVWTSPNNQSRTTTRQPPG